jgi:hypothetical protein
LRIIAFSVNANKKLQNLIDYLETEFPLKTKEKFILNFDKFIYFKIVQKHFQNQLLIVALEVCGFKTNDYLL